jgi:hypothetical protein
LGEVSVVEGGSGRQRGGVCKEGGGRRRAIGKKREAIEVVSSFCASLSSLSSIYFSSRGQNTSSFDASATQRGEERATVFVKRRRKGEEQNRAPWKKESMGELSKKKLTWNLVGA